jgi:hypothetical protein
MSNFPEMKASVAVDRRITVTGLVAFGSELVATSVKGDKAEGFEMADATRHFFSGSWPEFYDRLMVPVFIEPSRRLLCRTFSVATGRGLRTLPRRWLNQGCIVNYSH